MRRVSEVRPASTVGRLARDYGVDIFVGPFSRADGKREVSEWAFGPQGGALSITTRAVMIARDHEYEGIDEAVVFHEIAHVVMAVPFGRAELVPEELFALQWEKAVSRVYGVDPSRFEFYRASTRIQSMGGKRWREAKRDPELTDWYLDGEDRAERLGVVKNGLPVIGKWPDWSALTRADLDVLAKWRRRGHG